MTAQQQSGRVRRQALSLPEHHVHDLPGHDLDPPDEFAVPHDEDEIHGAGREVVVDVSGDMNGAPKVVLGAW